MARPNGPLTVCVINLKGGVGKSTITALLARHAFRSRGRDVLAIDLDPQANLSQALMGEFYKDFLQNKHPSIVEIFKGFVPASPSSAGAPIGSTTGVHTIARSKSGGNSLQLIPSRFDFAENLTKAVSPNPHVLAKFLAGNFMSKDLVIIDCAPTESILTHAAYHASGLVLVPVKPEFFATIGFPLLQESLDSFRTNNKGHTIAVAGVVINNGFYHGGNDGGPEKANALRDIRAEAKANSWHIFKQQIPFSRGFPKLMRGDYSYTGNADRFTYFAEEFFTTIGL